MNQEQMFNAESELRKGIPVHVVAEEYGFESAVEFTGLLRKNKIIDEVMRHELEYIFQNEGVTPPKTLMKHLGMAKTQYTQIINRFLGTGRYATGVKMTFDDMVQRTKWVIEEKMQLPINDRLPSQMNNDMFVDNNLYNVIKFAGIEKEKDPVYKNFSAVTYAVCKSYPGTFMPFQFKHPKRNMYFSGKKGRHNLMLALRWMVEEKLKMDVTLLPIVAQQKKWLVGKTLEFYGITKHTAWGQHFGSVEEVKGEILKMYAIPTNAGGSTLQLQKRLEDAGQLTGCCAICGGSENIHFHHIIGKRDKHSYPNIDIHCVENIVELCGTHHNKKAHQYKPRKGFKLTNLRRSFIKYMSK